MCDSFRACKKLQSLAPARLAMRLLSHGTRSSLSARTLPGVGRSSSALATKSLSIPNAAHTGSSFQSVHVLVPSTQTTKQTCQTTHMAVVQTPFAMTLSQQNKMYNVIQHSPQQPIIVSGTINQPAKTTVIHSKRPLAPAPERNSVLVTNNSDLRCKRKIQFMPYGAPQQQPASVARRNARERNRVKQVNNGFATLRQHIPPSVAQTLAPQGPSTGRGASKKLSKVETLRLAVEYIRSLKQMIEDHEGDLSGTGSENSLQDNRYYTSSPDQYHQSYPILLQTPSCSEASTSPTPSHSSEGSFSAASSYTNTMYQQENFEHYNEPQDEEGDEELLDAIFSWQQE